MADVVISSLRDSPVYLSVRVCACYDRGLSNFDIGSLRGVYVVKRVSYGMNGRAEVVQGLDK